MPETRVIVVADVHGLGGRVDELRDLLQGHAAAARGEPGCARFEVLERIRDAGELVLLSEWNDEGALRDHYAGAAFARYAQAVGPLLARPSDAVVHHVARTVRPVASGPPDPTALG